MRQIIGLVSVCLLWVGCGSGTNPVAPAQPALPQATEVTSKIGSQTYTRLTPLPNDLSIQPVLSLVPTDPATTRPMSGSGGGCLLQTVDNSRLNFTCQQDGFLNPGKVMSHTPYTVYVTDPARGNGSAAHVATEIFFDGWLLPASFIFPVTGGNEEGRIMFDDAGRVVPWPK